MWGLGTLHAQQTRTIMELLGGVWRTGLQWAFPLLNVYTRAEQHGKAGDSTSLNEAYEGKHRKCSLESHGRHISAVYIARTKGRKYVIGHSVVIINMYLASRMQVTTYNTHIKKFSDV